MTIDEMINTSNDLSQAVFLALGAASMCWTEIPSSEFKSSDATEIGNALITYVKEHSGE